MDREEYISRRSEFVIRGESLPQSKLTEDDVRKIRELHDFKISEIKKLNDSLSAKALAEKFDVHCRTIEKILSYETWTHVK